MGFSCFEPGEWKRGERDQRSRWLIDSFPFVSLLVDGCYPCKPWPTRINMTPAKPASGPHKLRTIQTRRAARLKSTWLSPVEPPNTLTTSTTSTLTCIAWHQVPWFPWAGLAPAPHRTLCGAFGLGGHGCRERGRKRGCRKKYDPAMFAIFRCGTIFCNRLLTGSCFCGMSFQDLVCWMIGNRDDVLDARVVLVLCLCYIIITDMARSTWCIQHTSSHPRWLDLAILGMVGLC